MPWTLTIHHLDIDAVGDATIIQASFPAAGGNAAIERTVLIDGGKTAAADIVDGYLAGIGVAALDAIIVTHFDMDHFFGINELLGRAANTRYDQAKLYDPGRLPFDREEWYTNAHGKRTLKVSEYSEYRYRADQRIGAGAGFRHVTRNVNSFSIVRYNLNGTVVPPAVVMKAIPSNAPVAAYQPPNVLIGKDLLWGNGDLAHWQEEPAAPYAPFRPTLTCVAVNKWVAQAPPAGGSLFCSHDTQANDFQDGDEIDEIENKNDNAKSIALLLGFNHFTYYVAGDIEHAQEEGWNNIYLAGGGVNPGLQFVLNDADTVQGRVLAMKASHHGAETASSRAFITRLRPSAAIISTGRSHLRYGHPGQATINVFDGYAEEPTLGDAGKKAAMRHPPQPPPPPLRPVAHYLTGYRDRDDLLSLGGVESQTAGDPDLGTPGHIRITVTEDESIRLPVGQTYRGTRAAAAAAAAGATVPLALNGAQLNAIADAATTLSTVHAVAVAVGAPVGAADAAMRRVALLGDDAYAGVDRIGIANWAVLPATIAAGASGVQAAMNVTFGGRVAQLGNATAAAIGVVVTNAVVGTAVAGLAAAVSTAAAPAGAAAARVAGAVADAACPIVDGLDDVVYAVAAAIGAMSVAGVTEGQAAAIAAACTVVVADANCRLCTRLVTAACLHGTLAAPLTPALAGLAGAVAAASYDFGEANTVRRATTAALHDAGVAVPAAQAAGVAARTAALAVNPNGLFTVSYDSVNGPENVVHFR